MGEEGKLGKDILHQKDEQGKEQQLQEVKRPPSVPFTKRILIVDDDPDITFTFKRAFEEKTDYYDLMLI